MAKFLHNIPSPKKVVTSMRSIGYTFQTSIADIIDNSISAHATKIDIEYSTNVDEPYIQIIDNGCGMNRDELLNALKFGTEKEYEQEDLGRFGLGLKAASLSQCRKFTVITKKDNVILSMGYNLDLIEEKNEWLVVEYDEKDIYETPNIEYLLNAQSGTIVMWENFDFIKQESKTGEYRKNLSKKINESIEHVALVFHRFYDDVKIFYNENRIPIRDPFLLNSKPRQQEGQETSINVENSIIYAKPYILPFANELTEEERELLGLKKGKSLYDDQGFYIYRNRRLLIWGSWLKLDTKDENSKLARIKVDIPSSLDNIWRLDVKKSSAQVPDNVKNFLRRAINDSTFKSKRTLKRPAKIEKESKSKIWLRSEYGEEGVSYTINTNNEIYKKVKEYLNDEGKSFFEAYVYEIEKNLPKFSIKDDIISNKNISNRQSENETELEDEFISLIQKFNSDINEDIINIFLNLEQFNSLKERKDEIIRRISNDK